MLENSPEMQAYKEAEDIHGIAMSKYVKEHHSKSSVDKVCNVKKENIHSVLSAISKSIYDILSFSQQSNEIPVIQEGQE